MKKLLLSFYLLAIQDPVYAFAAAIEKSPSPASKQWCVIVGEADSPTAILNQSKPGVYNVYSLDIKNIGDKKIKLKKVIAYRDDLNSPTDYEIFTVGEQRLLNQSYHHQNFPLSTNATKLKVVIFWTKTDDNSKKPKIYKEQFIFEQ